MRYNRLLRSFFLFSHILLATSCGGEAELDQDLFKEKGTISRAIRYPNALKQYFSILSEAFKEKGEVTVTTIDECAKVLANFEKKTDGLSEQERSAFSALEDVLKCLQQHKAGRKAAKKEKKAYKQMVEKAQDAFLALYKKESVIEASQEELEMIKDHHTISKKIATEHGGLLAYGYYDVYLALCRLRSDLSSIWATVRPTGTFHYPPKPEQMKSAGNYFKKAGRKFNNKVVVENNKKAKRTK